MSGMFSGMKPGDDDPEHAKNTRRIGLYTGIPSMFMGGLLAGYFGGHWLDKHFEKDGVFTGVGVILGLVAAMYSIFKMIMKESKDD